MIDVHQNATLSESFKSDRSRVIGNRCNVNTVFDTNQIDNDALMSQCIRSRFFSPHSLKQFSGK